MRSILVLLAIVLTIRCTEDIMSFGAVPNSDTLPDQFKNSKAILAAILRANSSATDRTVRIPAHKFYTMPVRV